MDYAGSQLRSRSCHQPSPAKPFAPADVRCGWCDRSILHRTQDGPVTIITIREQRSVDVDKSYHSIPAKQTYTSIHCISLQYLRLMMTGRAASHGPLISFLYFCSPINHQLHPPIANPATTAPTPIPTTPSLTGPLLPATIPVPPPAPSTSNAVRRACTRGLSLVYRLSTGNSPNTSMLRTVRLKTCPVEGSRDASTVEAMRAALVESEAGQFGPWEE